MPEIETAVKVFTSAVTHFAEESSPQATQDLALAICLINDLHSRSERAAVLRPYVALRAAMLESSGRVAALWGMYRETLTAPTVREVQRLNVRASDSLRSWRAPIDEYEEKLRRSISQSGEAGQTLIERTLGFLTDAHEGTLLDIASLGVERAERLTGRSVSPGAGTQFLVQSHVASVWLDNERFERTVVEASDFCRFADVDAVLRSDLPLLGLAASQRRLAEAVLGFEAILSVETDEETIFRRLLKYHAEVYEEVGGPIFAWYLLLSGAKTRPYEKLIEEGATALAKAVNAEKSLASWFQGNERLLRNAPSHVGGYWIEKDLVHVTLGSEKISQSIGWFVDRAYTFLESVMATSWALFNELERRDIDIPFSEADKAYLGLTSFAMADMFAKMSFGALECRDDDGDWHFALPSGEADAVAKAVALMTTNADVRSVTVSRAGAESTLRVSLTAWETYESAVIDASVEDIVVAGVEFRAACTLRGKSALSESDLRAAVGVFGSKLLAGDLTLVRQLRRLDRLAVSHSYAETHNRIVSALATLRADDQSERARLAADFRIWMQGDLSLPTADSAVVVRTA
ncbi:MULTISPECIES: hypothetical protein [unclassified Microbacterium]|uniref:hypothetical protein n=1 Tax=unclassified Microbacterium TaxID=2609290 RepID=UPI0012F88647|nr:hypothetical protein [Microbacterium sp. MAH-37]MVQ41726.1 hypothetical protein [Microbacterium sp. MAH-37]